MTAPLIKPHDPCWSVIKSNTVYNADGRLRVVRQTVCLPDDTVIDDFYRVDLASFTAIYALTDQDDVLLLRQYKHGVGKVCLTLPGGQIDPGEHPEFSARRELLEETGYGGGRWVYGQSLVLHGNQGIAQVHVFVAQHVIKLTEISSGDLEKATLVTKGRKDLRKLVLEGELPITTHVAAIGVAEAFFDAEA